MSNKTSWRLGAPAIALVLLLAGCGSSDDLGGTVVKDGVGCSPTEVEPRTDAPTIEQVAEAPAEVDTEDLEEGDGCGISTDTYVTLDLVGATADDATVFADTFEDERPITATLGSGQLLPGLETGLEGMAVGGRRQVTLPADAAYGADGNLAQGIGPDEALVFVVDLVAVSDTPIYCNAATGIPAGPEGSDKPTTVEMPVDAPVDEVVKTDLTEGTGDPVEVGNYVTVNYLGVSCASGQQFDSSWDGGEPFPITLGEGTIPGFATGIEGMKVGGLRRIEIPADQAYGAQGSPPSIGANDPLVFIISVVAAEDAPPTSTTAAAPTEVPTTAAGDTTTTVAGDPTTTSTVAGDEATTTTEADAETTTTTEP